MILTLCKMQTVNFYKLSTAFESSFEVLSCIRFMYSYELDFDIITRLIVALPLHKGPYFLSKEQTNWQFGTNDINALVLDITYEGVAFPILFRLFPKWGNSNTAERIEIIEQFIRFFSESSIESLVGDRKFIGEKWHGVSK